MTTTRRRAPRAEPSSKPLPVPRQRGRVRTLLTFGRSPSTAVMVCVECELQGGPFATAEARHLATVHDRLHHYGARNAEVKP